MAQAVRFELLGDASDLQNAFSEGASSAEVMEENLNGLEESVETLLKGQVELNQAAQRFTDEGGNFISTTEAQERALQDLNAEGIETVDQIREQVQRLEALEEIYENDAKASAALSDRQQQLRTELTEVGEAAAQQNRDLSRLDQQFGSTTVRMGGFAEQQEQLQQELRESANAQRQFSGASGSADQAVVSLSRGLEDVAFARDFGDAMRFAGNNVTQAAQSIGRAQNEAGGLVAAFKSITPATLGIAAFTALVAIGPRVVDFFSDAEESAESFEDRVDEVADSVFRLRDASQEPIRLGLEQAQQAVEILGDDLEQLRTLREELQRGSLQRRRTGFTQLGQQQFTSFGFGDEQLEQLQQREELSESAQDQIDEIIQQRKDLNQILRAQRRTLAEGSKITKAQVRQIQEGTASTEALVTASEEGVVRFSRLSQLAEDLLGRYQSVTQLLQGQNRLVGENLITQEQVTQELTDRLGDAEDIEDVQERLNGAVEDGLITREQMQAVMEDIRSDTGDTADASEELAQAQQNITRALEEEIIAREEANALLEDLGTSNDQIARSTAEALGNVQDLSAEYSDLLSPQGVALAQARRTKEEFQGQVQALRNVNRIVARRQSGTEAEQVEGAGPATGDLGTSIDQLEEEVQRLNQSLSETGEEAEAAGDSVNQNVNRELVQGIQLASQLGATLIQSAQEGSLSFQQAFSSILQTVGAVVGIANPAIGAGISGAGTLIGSFKDGGTMPRSGLAQLHPPEIVTGLPGGAQVVARDETMDMLAAQSGRDVTIRLEAETKRTGPAELGTVLREVERFENRHPTRR